MNTQNMQHQSPTRKLSKKNDPSGSKLDHQAHILICFILSALLFSTTAGVGEPYSIDWFTIDGGGGASSGGAYSVSGTIGQPDAGVLAGGNYVVSGGFWSFLAAPASAPLLSITRAGNAVIVSWPAPLPGFVLQENSNLSIVGWNNTAATISILDGKSQISVPSPIGNRFYRLKK